MAKTLPQARFTTARHPPLPRAPLAASRRAADNRSLANATRPSATHETKVPMTAEAQWIASAGASALYWTKCRFAHPDRELSSSPKVAVAADALASQLALENLDEQAFFAHALPLCVRLEPPRQLVEVVLTKLHGSGRTTGSEVLAREIAALYRAFLRHAPGLVDELELRTGPIRDQWEARGPGLLAMLRRLTEPEVAPERAEIVLVRPVTGGGGEAFPPYNSVLLEAVLTNSVSELPEVVRLAWLWSQLSFDLPKYFETLGHTRITSVGKLALVPAVLAAASEVELARCDAETISAALDTWGVAASPELLLDWWTTYQESRTPWIVALAGLERLLAGE